MSEMKDYYTIKKMNGYYRIGCAEKSFGYLITGKDKAALIDTGSGFGDLKSAIRQVTDLPLYIITAPGVQEIWSLLRRETSLPWTELPWRLFSHPVIPKEKYLFYIKKKI